MRDGFLFDDGDKKQRGKGCDRLGTKRDGLKLKWQWSGRTGRKRLPCQTCVADVGEFCLEAIFWHTDYEAMLSFVAHRLVSHHGKSFGDSYRGEVLVTRLQAQLKAEELFVDFYIRMGNLLKKHKLISDT